eukprot:CAMPEP_0178913322 /NCGR_PEP_ID=MMETSP0786-20121207/10777_1 /TAXON_ID=186022 /ORGANISM="Thalassionema frauenfeldii, Strain CCMP 1798" /LENGTH=155 /DNA_ID=CAMNT_0020586049 /DNA_START=75 /DNA_END=542 /DNA_ORIENTATION=-
MASYPLSFAFFLFTALLMLKEISVTAFASSSKKTEWKMRTSTVFSSSSADGEQAEEPTLLIGEDLDKELKQIKSKYPTSEADYLAAARKRAQEKKESVNSLSKDEDWQVVAEKKGEEGDDDDWENSDDSQILLPDLGSDNTGEDGEEKEPELLLF